MKPATVEERAATTGDGGGAGGDFWIGNEADEAVEGGEEVDIDDL